MLATDALSLCSWRVVALVLVSGLSSSVSAQSGTRASAPPRVPASAQATGVAVVELFTSQGCSSCPSADAALRQIASVAEQGNLQVYTLSFHVDYWSHLGWKDPYSDPAYSNRQRAYASATGSKRIYTPQMIVSGTTEFVGSDKAKAHAAITKSLSQRPSSTVKLKVIENAMTDRVTVQYDVTGAIAGTVLNVALVQSPQPNKVLRGENIGRELGYVNVVRAFETLPLIQSSGTVKLEIPDDVDAGTAMVIAYVQNPKSLGITAAASTKL